MRTYLITYDLSSPVRHNLAGAIMQLGDSWARPLDATWYVQSAERPEALERRLEPYLSGDDGLLIQQVEASAVLLNTALRWFRKRRPESTEAGNVVAFPVPKMPEAKAKYEKVIALDSRAPVAANNLAWIYAETGGNLDIALQLAQTAKGQLPERPEVNDTLGWLYYKKGLSTLAVPPLKESVKSDPKNPIYQYHLGLAYAKNGDTANARQALTQALALKADFEGAADAKRVLASLAG